MFFMCSKEPYHWDGSFEYPQHMFWLTLNAPIATKVVCFCRLLKCLRSLYGKQCGPRSDCSYMLFASLLYSSVMLGNYLRQTTFSDAFFLGALRVKYVFMCSKEPYHWDSSFEYPRHMFLLINKNNFQLRTPFLSRGLANMRVWMGGSGIHYSLKI